MSAELFARPAPTSRVSRVGIVPWGPEQEPPPNPGRPDPPFDPDQYLERVRTAPRRNFQRLMARLASLLPGTPKSWHTCDLPSPEPFGLPPEDPKERAKLRAMVARVQECRDTLSSLTEQLREAEAALKADEIAAAVGERPISPALRARAEDLRERRRTAQLVVEHGDRAIEEQARVVRNRGLTAAQRRAKIEALLKHRAECRQIQAATLYRFLEARAAEEALIKATTAWREGDDVNRDLNVRGRLGLVTPDLVDRWTREVLSELPTNPSNGKGAA